MFYVKLKHTVAANLNFTIDRRSNIRITLVCTSISPYSSQNTIFIGTISILSVVAYFKDNAVHL